MKWQVIRTGVFLRLSFCEVYQYLHPISLKKQKVLGKMLHTHVRIKVNCW